MVASLSLNLQAKTKRKIMKKFNLLAAGLFLAGTFTMISCGGGSQQSKDDQEQEQKQMKEADTKQTKEEEDKEADEDQNVVDKTSVEGKVEVTVNTPGESMQEMRYDVDVIKANSGQQVKLTLNNPAEAEAMKHNFVIVKKADAKSVAKAGLEAGKEQGYLPEDSDKIYAASELVDPGRQTTFEFSLDAAGKYEFICTYPGHYPLMKGKIVVD